MTKILVIEDEAILRKEIEMWLRQEGYEVLSAADGVIGVEIASHQPLDLIVCDVTMPRLDGYSVLLALHADLATTGTPFIFITARTSHEDIRQGMVLGADDYITKPFTRQELLQTIQTRLAKKAAQEQAHQHIVEQLQQAVAQEHALRLLKTQLVAMFSHDFRNPLANILMTNSLLRDQAPLMDEQRRLVRFNRIEASVNQLIQLLDDVLIVAQLDVGKFACRPEPLQIGEFLQQIVMDFQATSDEKQLIFLESHITEPVLLDQRLLYQIVSNLLSNAIKYSQPGGAVYITFDNCANGAEQCCLSIRDQGIGISTADQASIFEAFQRGSNVGTIPGTGLGLTIIKEAVALHGGSISLESELGVGTVFYIRLPLTISHTHEHKGA